MPKTANIKVEVGTQFRYNYADSNPLWEVKKARGKGTWECEVLPAPMEIPDGKGGTIKLEGDWVGQRKVFGTEEIARSIGMSQFWNKLGNESDKFYAGLKEGQIVHYDNGFESYIRCRVVRADIDRDKIRVRKGENVLVPIALVGNWRKHDLPTRYRNGQVYLGYNAETIDKGEPMHPHATSIYENPNFANKERKTLDPRKLDPIDLTVPPMTPDEEKTAKLWQKVEEIKGIIEEGSRGDDPKAVLDSIYRALLPVYVR
jgi:hypothetical protein